MEIQLIAGLGFGAVLIVFFMIAWFVPPAQSGNDNILRILAAILAGCAGAFLTGAITIELAGPLSGSVNLVVSAAGGAALFLLVWVTWTRKLSPGFHLTLPQGTPFAEAARMISQATEKTCRLDGFPEAAEQSVVSSETPIRQRSPRAALVVLHEFFPKGEVPKYTVTETATGWRLIANEEGGNGG
ncbi:hypothetical protein [Lentisalinibacter salinarum]|uniref:hypothetical protein n=1 Tax=Lentisalinibacter salinarum TaxID=2992239 RepID=UPI003865984C